MPDRKASAMSAMSSPSGAKDPIYPIPGRKDSAGNFFNPAEWKSFPMAY